MISLQACHAAARVTLRDGGGTFRADTLEPVTRATGYAVGLVAGTADSADTDLARVALAIARVVGRYPAAPFVGTWLNGGTVHVDPIVILQSKRDALTLARATGQLAVWSFRTQEEITL